MKSNPEKVRDLRGISNSRKIAAMLDQTGLNLEIGEAKKLGSGRVANSENIMDSDFYTKSKGDSRVAKKVKEDHEILSKGSMDVEEYKTLGASKKVTIQASRYMNTLAEEKLGRTANVVEEQSNQAQKAYTRIIKLASKLLARGQMTPEVSVSIESRLSDLKDHGARSSKISRRIEKQIASMNGSLEY
jgi:hypothetical protein